jgi:colanic acid biosynthesis glycosyl transferase WcaI
MKICILSEYFYPDSTGGTGAVLSILVRRLKDEYPHLEIDVITSKNLFRGEQDALVAEEEWDGINIRRLSAPQPRKKSVRRRLGANMVFTMQVLRTLLRQPKRYDLLLVVTAPPTLPLAAHLFSRMTRTPFVYLVYDLYLDLALALNMVSPDSKLVQRMRSVQQNWFRSASRVVVLGRCMRDLVADKYAVPLARIEVVPIPSNLNLITPQPKQTHFRTENNLNGFVVLYAGNFAQYQDFDTLLNAAKLLRERADVTFVFVGDGAKKTYIQDRVASEELSNVCVLPFVPEEDLSDMLASADVSLVTLERGTAGLAVPSKFYNILASGRPTVAVIDSSSEIARVINESGCGICVEPENAVDLADVLSNLASDPEEAERMGHIARDLCESHYSLSHIAHSFHNVFEDVIASTETPIGYFHQWRDKRSKVEGKID